MAPTIFLLQREDRTRQHVETFSQYDGQRKVVRHRGGITLHMIISHQDLAHQAGELFLQPVPPIPLPILMNEGIGVSTGMNELFTMAQLLQAPQYINLSSAPGLDEVTATVLRILPENQLLRLMNWFDDVWVSSHTPSYWLESTVIPIPKPGKPPTDIVNLRPISLTSTICKLMAPFTMAPRHSCSTCHIKLASNDTCLHKIAYSLSIMTSQPTRSSDPHPGSSWQSTSKKAFDSVPHISVVEGAIQRGVRGRTLEFIIAFLSSRTYHISVGNTLSPNRTNNIGVP